MDVSLGEITCPSGELVVVDGGYLGLWSGDASPMDTDPEVLGRSADLEVDGDVAHRELVRRVAAAGGGQFSMGNVAAVGIGGLPVDRLLSVVARPVGSAEVSSPDVGSPDVGNPDVSSDVDDGWESISVIVTSAPVVRSAQLGSLVVDWARIAFADADALAHWRHDDSIDGLADVAFWGAAEDEAARAFGAPLVGTPGEEGVHGWTDLPAEEAARRGLEITEWRDADPARRLMVDFRPHSHHWQIMRGVRASRHGAGMVEVGRAWVLCAMTGWGDGVFPVFADIDQDGALVGVRVMLADAD